jgi:hypothetical protein
MKRQGRQGDVLLTVVEREPSKVEIPRENGRIVLAHGEVTGHAHAISDPTAMLFVDPEIIDETLKVGLLKSSRTATLKHEEHDHFVFPAAVIEVRRQREYRPEGLLQVAD